MKEKRERVWEKKQKGIKYKENNQKQRGRKDNKNWPILAIQKDRYKDRPTDTSTEYLCY